MVLWMLCRYVVVLDVYVMMGLKRRGRAGEGQKERRGGREGGGGGGGRGGGGGGKITASRL